VPEALSPQGQICRLAKEASIRTLVLDGDHIDMRVHGKEQTEGRVSAFMEAFGGT
jgi:hypothetical protein